ncbi:hypothetical protein AT15_09665 [Kosmotoga arenicorallina S304]|uniref:Methionyl/Leucyl tRNA synthetase domain-containing protein n=1 Tax=Kosmotoga arenicorallina S304 TaxID=1453497 RepID=A0A176K0X9_9BACT|nr:hypothetical protein [Kosmotoga arenicorallina]OAA30687.1 hypothetical protein AT15_09665 [Kosmotoga arenicorallina S304]
MFALHVKCPHCFKSLMNSKRMIDAHPSIQLSVSYGDHHGTIWLSAMYGSYNYSMTFDMPDGEIAEFFCPHCGHSLTGSVNCPDCSAKTVQLELEKGGNVHFCPRKGCKGHLIAFDSENELIEEAYKHYQYMEPEED